ncbi:MAG: Methyltransferase type 11 [Candidatus Moranbacteria bacterium GW2011_GWC2_37_8]|nr:MAG: Methyltransferase type 11 [Candidatus Moranbacteria bacterium GW2011_GWC2_37_8]KKQ62574.1 MAG: methyltransferase type 11 [Parcubacteria group bacterium GW2011_GWC1_38_22]
MSVKVLRERGMASLFFRIWHYISEFARTFLKSGDVLYVSGCPGGSRFYRCSNQSEELLQYGITSTVVSQDNISLLLLSKKFKVFILQRVIHNDHIKKFIREVEAQKKTIIFETDDLVFDPQYIPQMHYYTYMGEEERSWYDNGIGREILEDSYVSHCVVSTKYLADAIKLKYPEKAVFISKNKMNANQVKWAKNALKKEKEIKKNDGKVRIGYFSGSKSHDNDFDTVSDVLVRVLKENANAVLVIVGYLKLNGKFADVESQIEYQAFVPMKRLPELILNVDINIAPLEIDNPFCQAKSALKFFEAGIVGVPTLATATSSFKDTITHGKDGLLAADENQWHDCLNKLIKDDGFRIEMGKNAQKTAVEHYIDTKKHSEINEFVNFLKEKIQK